MAIDEEQSVRHGTKGWPTLRPVPAKTLAPDVRIHGDAALPTLVYLPGLHGDWTLLTRFRRAVAGRVRLVEITYPRWTRESLHEQAALIDAVLAAHGVDRGWVLAESFGSQVAWPLVGGHGRNFRANGLILAGGFVRHPWLFGVRLARALARHLPIRVMHLNLRVLLHLARLWHRNDPETLASLAEFAARRTEEDREAACHRLDLIATSDLRPLAAQARIPVYFVTGLLDLIVPWPPVRSWLRRNCPGWKGDHVLGLADHPVLTSAPRATAKIVLMWMRA